MLQEHKREITTLNIYKGFHDVHNEFMCTQCQAKLWQFINFLLNVIFGTGMQACDIRFNGSNSLDA